MTLTGSTNDQFMALAGLRYCLSRASYATGIGQDWLRATWGQLTPQTRNTIVRDIVEALMDGHAGMEMDRAGWREAARWAWARMEPEDRDRVMRETAHKHAPWPFDTTLKEELAGP